MVETTEGSESAGNQWPREIDCNEIVRRRTWQDSARTLFSGLALSFLNSVSLSMRRAFRLAPVKTKKLAAELARRVQTKKWDPVFFLGYFSRHARPA